MKTVQTGLSTDLFANFLKTKFACDVARSVTFFLTKDLADHELSVLFDSCQSRFFETQAIFYLTYGRHTRAEATFSLFASG